MNSDSPAPTLEITLDVSNVNITISDYFVLAVIDLLFSVQEAYNNHQDGSIGDSELEEGKFDIDERVISKPGGDQEDVEYDEKDAHNSKAELENDDITEVGVRYSTSEQSQIIKSNVVKADSNRREQILQHIQVRFIGLNISKIYC